MKKWIYAAVAAPLLLGGAPIAAAQEPRVITFEEALELALERNPILRRAQNASEMTDIELQQERMQFIPEVRLSTQTAQRYGRYFNQDEGRIFNQSSNAVNAGLSSSVVLFDGFSNVASLQRARLESGASDLEVDRARETVLFTVMSNYLSLVEQQEQLRVRLETLAALEAQEREIREYVDAGARPISDLYQQQASVASARLARVQAERALDLARMELIRTLQLDPLGEYEFEVPSIQGDPAASVDAALTVLSERAVDGRADLQAAQLRVNAAEEGVRVATRSRWPTISLSAGYNSSFISGTDFGFLDQLDQRRGGSVGLSFSFPLLDRQSTRLATERARVEAENARIELESARQEVALEVRTAQLDLRAAREQLREAEAQLRAAELALETSQERYDVGAATLVELTQARAAQVQSASDLVSARYALLFHERLMDYYLGNLQPEALRAR